MNKDETLVHASQVEIAGIRYKVEVFMREDGRHVARTVLARDDVLINDAPSMEEVLDKHRELLPLAIDSRTMLQSYYASRKK